MGCSKKRAYCQKNLPHHPFAYCPPPATEGLHIFKKTLKMVLKIFTYSFLVFTEEIAFKHFLFINITKLRFFLFFMITQTLKELQNYFGRLILCPPQKIGVNTIIILNCYFSK